MDKIRPFFHYLLILVLSIVLHSCESSTSIPKVTNGTIDLHTWDFDQNGNIKLNGEWEFYWKTFLYDTLNSAASTPKSELITVPGLWNKTLLNGIPIKGKGFASYRLMLSHLPKEQLAIKYLNGATSCAIYIDGELLYKAGKPGKTEFETIPSYKPSIVYFTPKSEKTEIVLQIANYQHKKGGQWEPILLGKAENVKQYWEQKTFTELILIGGILFMAIFHLFIFVKHPYEKPLFWFSIFSLFIAAKLIVSGEFSIYLLGNFRWINLVRIDYLSFYLAILSFLFYLKSLFPKEVSKVVSFIVICAAIVSSLSVLVLPLSYFSHGMIYFQSLSIIGSIYAFYVLYLANKRKHKGVNYFIYGFTAIFIAMLHDILNENEIFYSISFIPIGLTLFIIFQALTLSSRIRYALTSNVHLSQELKIQNEEYLSLNNKYKKQNESLKKAKEKAEESDRFKSAFLANISHEIRTPMNGILGFTELLSHTGLDDEKRLLYLSILKERGQHLLGVINDIIDISKIETGLIEVRNDAVNLNELMLKLFNNYYQAAHIKHLKFIQNTSFSDNESNILIDKQKLEQILSNLISNAIKFTNSGKVEFGYQLINNNLEFHVKDTGIGVSKNEIKIIFDRFNQANIDIAHKYGGTGLGLSIVKAYVKKLGGDVSVESSTGRGSDFLFTVPYIPQPTSTEKISSTQKVKPPSQLTILLVEDDTSNAFLIQEMLEEINPILLHAINGDEALEFFQKNEQIDIVLMDIKLPDTNGYELTKKFKSIRQQIPIVAQTAFALKGDKEKALEAGCIDHISKPIDGKDLINKIYIYTNNQ